MVLATCAGVNAFTLDPSIGEFILTAPHIRIPEKPKMVRAGPLNPARALLTSAFPPLPRPPQIYSVNEGNARHWDDATRAFVEEVKNGGDKPYSARYVGSMVSDVHRTLLYGGIFMYPGDRKSPAGKLRLLYEGNPMAFICEAAGGAAFTGKGRVLDLEPESIHQRTPIFLGCRRDVARVEALYEEHELKQEEKRARTDNE